MIYPGGFHFVKPLYLFLLTVSYLFVSVGLNLVLDCLRKELIRGGQEGILIGTRFVGWGAAAVSAACGFGWLAWNCRSSAPREDPWPRSSWSKRSRAFWMG